MKIEYWFETDVNKDGTLGSPVQPMRGSVETDAQLKTCYAPHWDTPSSRKHPFWLFISTGRLKDGSIHGVTIYFDNEPEMNRFFESKKGAGEVV